MRAFLLSILALWIVTPSHGFARAKAAESALASQATLRFDIPSQPLDQALWAYSTSTGLEIFYNAALVERRPSHPVVGFFTQSGALRKLLQDTGYAPRATAPGSFIVVPDALAHRSSPDSEGGNRRYGTYLAGVQANITSALCAGPLREPSGGDVLIQIWLASNGAISRALVLGSDGGRNDRIAELVRTAHVDVPPADIPQPVTLAIFPPSQVAGEKCRARRDKNAMSAGAVTAVPATR